MIVNLYQDLPYARLVEEVRQHDAMWAMRHSTNPRDPSLLNSSRPYRYFAFPQPDREFVVEMWQALQSMKPHHKTRITIDSGSTPYQALRNTFDSWLFQKASLE